MAGRSMQIVKNKIKIVSKLASSEFFYKLADPVWYIILFIFLWSELQKIKF